LKHGYRILYNGLELDETDWINFSDDANY